MAVGLSLWLLAGCAAHRPAVEAPGAVAAADDLAAAGCFTCLRDALAAYDRLAAGRTPSAALRQRQFETAILLTLRAKELGLPFEPWLARARGAAPGAPPAAGAADLLEFVDLAPMETSGLAPQLPGLSPFVRDVVPAADAWRARLAAAGPSPRLQEYLDLTLICADREARDAALAARPAPADPLLRYRQATCGPMPDADAGRLLAADPRWAEAAWFEGRRVLAAERDVPRAITLLAEAARAFPESGAMLMSLAGAQRAAGELDAALANYDAVAALVPEQREALLGRVLCLTYLNRQEEAVAAATRMIDLGMYLLADAYYWRAWNLYQLQRLDAAWADVTAALKLQTSTNVHTLAGLVAYGRREIDTALEHFDRAWTLDRANCTAAFYKGLVQAERQAWREAALTFDAAMTCFTTAAAAARAELTALLASSQPDAFKARQGAEHEKTIADNERQAAVAAYDAAEAFARTGQVAAARAHLDRATHDAVRDKAEALRKRLPQ